MILQDLKAKVRPRIKKLKLIFALTLRQWFNYAPKKLALSDVLALNGFAVTVQPVAVQVKADLHSQHFRL